MVGLFSKDWAFTDWFMNEYEASAFRQAQKYMAQTRTKPDIGDLLNSCRTSEEK